MKLDPLLTTQDGRRFEMWCDLLDVTSLHRPDPSWRYMDRAGHEHRWWTEGKPAEGYSPSKSYDTPTLIWVKDGVGYYEDGEPYDIGHCECRQCGEHIEPRNTADTNTQYIAGLKHCSIDGIEVDIETFEREYLKARARLP